MRKKFIRSLVIGVFIAALSAYNYSHLKDADNISAIDIVNLLVCGAGIGMFLMSVMGLFFWKKD